MIFFSATTALRYFSSTARIFSLLSLFSFALVFFIFYIFLYSKELRWKLGALLAFYFIFRVLFFICRNQIYSILIGELLEDRAVRRDPQNLVTLIFYQTLFWAFFSSLPILMYYVYTYLASRFTFRTLIRLKIAFIIFFTLQFFSFIRTYRWIFYDWLLVFSSLPTDEEFYVFEPDIFRIFIAFYTEILDFYFLLRIFIFFFYFSIKGNLFMLWQKKRLSLFLFFVVVLSFLVFQITFSVPQIIMAFLVFDLTGFRVYFYYYLGLRKKFY